jgi:hypothetical protein
MLVRLFRKGVFNVVALNVPGRCGDIRPSLCGYEVQITIDERDLDNNGFVCRQRSLLAYFHNSYGERPTGLSCERMAVHAVKHFKKMFARTGKNFVNVRVRISPSDSPERWAEAID